MLNNMATDHHICQYIRTCFVVITASELQTAIQHLIRPAVTGVKSKARVSFTFFYQPADELPLTASYFYNIAVLYTFFFQKVLHKRIQVFLKNRGTGLVIIILITVLKFFRFEGGVKYKAAIRTYSHLQDTTLN